MQAIADYYDIVILPSSKVREYSIRLSREINRRFGSETVLSNIQNLPHISLFHTAFSQSNLPFVRERLADIARDAEPFEVSVHGFLLAPHYGSVSLTVEPKLPFIEIHERVIARTRDYVDRDFDYRTQWYYDEAPEKEQAYIDEFTTPLVKEYFHPHITLNNGMKKERVSEVKNAMKLKRDSFQIDAIVLCSLAEFHTCQEVVFRFPFT